MGRPAALLTSMALVLPGLGWRQAQAQEEALPSRVETPGIGLAGESCTSTITSNPALFGLDPDPGYAVRYQQRLYDPLSAVQLNATVGGTGFGLFYRGSASTQSFWALQTSAALRLAEQLSFGANFWWNLPQGSDNNFVSWDLGLAYRPAPFLGLGAVAQNIGSPSLQYGVTGRYGLGVALRPMSGFLTLGADQFFLEPTSEGSGQDSAGSDSTASAASADSDAAEMSYETRITLGLAPRRGLLLRLYGTNRMEFGGGVQLAFGGVGLGAYGADMLSDAPMFTAAAVSTPSSERLFGLGKRIPTFRIRTAYPYEPRATLFSPPQESYLRLLVRLKGAVDDPAVRGVLIHLDREPFSMAQTEELRDLIGKLRARGRQVVVYLDASSGNKAYFLATAADRIYLHPAAGLDLTGLSAELTYFRGTLDLLGVQPQFHARSEYKSSPESFTRSEPSDSSAEQMNALLDDLYGALEGAIAEGRRVERERARELVDGGPYTADEAQALALVDGLLYPDDLEEDLEGVFPDNYVLDEDYLANVEHSGWQSPRRIALVVISGLISSGKTTPPSFFGQGSAGAETVIQALEQARDDHTVRAVVLRVDSPGGSAYASDDIWHAISQLVEAGKPVVVSMGGTAASGGYYVAAGATAVYAEPSTITGSIGVYGGKFSFGGLYQKLGISSTLLTRGRKAGMWSVSRPLDPVEEASMARLLDDTYAKFKARVAEGRGLDEAEVERIARGRVWSGRRAKEVGLVDELGGLYDAIDRARDEAGIREGAEFELLTYGSQPNRLGQLPLKLLKAAVGPVEEMEELQALRSLRALEDDRIFMIMPYELELR